EGTRLDAGRLEQLHEVIAVATCPPSRNLRGILDHQPPSSRCLLRIEQHTLKLVDRHPSVTIREAVHVTHHDSHSHKQGHVVDRCDQRSALGGGVIYASGSHTIQVPTDPAQASTRCLVD